MDVKTQNHKILKSTILFAGFVFLAQILGLVRDLFLTRYFGVGNILDTYYLAFKVPDFLNVFYSVFLGSVVFIPLLTAAKNKTPTPGGQGALRPPGVGDNEDEIVKVIRSIGSMVFYLITIIGVLLFIFMPLLSTILAPTWSPQQQELHTSMSRILLIAQFFFPIGILAGSIGMIYERPFFMAISGFVYNLFILLGVVIFGNIYGIYGAIIGVLVGSIMFAVVQIIPVEVRNVFKEFRFQFNWASWINFFKQNFARFIAVLAYQLFGVILIYIATYSGAGGVSVFTISYNLYLALFFILGASLSTATMPNVSKLHVTGDKLAQKENLNNALVYMFFVGCFITLFGYIFSLDIVQILYYFSHIGTDKEIYIASTFAVLILALPFFNLLEIIRKYLYSTNQIYFASTMTVILLVSVFVFSLTFGKVFSMSVLPSLSLAIFLSNIVCLFFALLVLRNKGQIDLGEIIKNGWKVVLFSILSLLTFHFIFNLVLGLSGLYFENLPAQAGYFLELILRAIVLFLIFLGYTYLFNDIVGKTVWRQILRFVI